MELREVKKEYEDLEQQISEKITMEKQKKQIKANVPVSSSSVEVQTGISGRI